MTRFSNPLLGILAGALFTAIIQSSSASVGIFAGAGGQRSDQPLQRGLCPFWSKYRHLHHRCAGLHRYQPQRQAHHHHPSAVQHHRHCALYHHLHVLPADGSGGELHPQQSGGPDRQYAHALQHHHHDPAAALGNQLAAIATRILPERAYEDSQTQKLLYIKPLDTLPDSKMGNSAIAVNSLRQELSRMAGMVEHNVDESFLAVLDGKAERLPGVKKTEDYVDYINREVTKYISRSSPMRTTPGIPPSSARI